MGGYDPCTIIDFEIPKKYGLKQTIADTLGILNNPAEYKVGTLSAGEYWIGVKAINEGTTSPASASVSLGDDKVEKEFIMAAWVDSAASWKVIVK